MPSCRRGGAELSRSIHFGRGCGGADSRTGLSAPRPLSALFLTAALFALIFSSCAGSGPSVAPPQPQAKIQVQPAPQAKTQPTPATTAIAESAKSLNLDPKALEKYRTMRIDPRVQSVSRDLTQNVSSNPSRYLPDLVKRLTAGEQDPFMKVKLIHDWIADNISYDYTMFANGLVVNQDVESVLRSKKAVCSGYSGLFQRMAELAGIKSDIVSGYAKGIGSSYSLDQRNSHSWNIVHILGGLYIVDATWDAGSIDKGYFVKDYGTDYLFIAPADNLYTHFPKNPSNQLMDRSIDGAVFLKMPDLQGGFFRYGLSLETRGIESLMSTAGTFYLEIKAQKPDVQIDASLKDGSGKEIDSAAFVTRSGPTTWRIRFSIPSIGNYKGIIYAGSGKIPSGTELGGSQPAAGQEGKQSSTDKLEGVMSINFENTAGRGETKAFPRVYASYNEKYGEELVSPMKGVLSAGSSEYFEYKSASAKDVALIVGKNFFSLNPVGNGVFALNFTVPETSDLKLGVSDGGGKYWITLGWEIAR